jgi:hypothetical protein
LKSAAGNDNSKLLYLALENGATNYQEAFREACHVGARWIMRLMLSLAHQTERSIVCDCRDKICDHFNEEDISSLNIVSTDGYYK